MRSFDGTKLLATYYPAASLPSGERAPTVLVGHGWGGHRALDPDSASSPAGSIGLRPLRLAGYNILTWDARGFGASGGEARLDDPASEGRDVSALIDAVAQQPDAVLDGPGDPRVGMVGSSYAGGIQLIAAGQDQRIDAIVPDLAWNSLREGLTPDGAFKAGWGRILLGLGVSQSLVPGLIAKTGLESGSLDPAVTRALTEGVMTDALTPPSIALLHARDVSTLVGRITAPTFLTQGTPDTLLTLRQAIANHAILRRNGVPVKMLWHCGGHGACLSNPGSEPHRIERAVLAWFARYLQRDPLAETGPGFEWVSQDGVWHSAPDYPPAPAPATWAARGAGTLAITPGVGPGNFVTSAPSPLALSVPLPPPTEELDVVGPPQLTLAYQGAARGGPSVPVFAQLVDLDSGTVVGGQVTPLPVVLDGAPRTISRDLETVALHVRPGARYALQLMPASSLFRAQTASGTFTVTRADVTLPVVQPGLQAPPPPAASVRAAEGRVTVTVPGVVRAARGKRALQVRLRADGVALRAADVRVIDPFGRRVGTLVIRSRVRAGAARLVRVRLAGKLRRVRYRVAVRYTTTAGRHGTASRSITLP
ncbi:hypothetical protein DSM112329_04091 [Paraconexibacter sp. AEG42_29]|uniref:Xaa-Pro dipeptidyl-peptidase C-terminal domain-containing protein n=1 Tax=Paraconexibacter sp. AEG42_29 TaxID=2997339 RepID=A0AAU7AZQ2_9ACTN